MSTGHMEDQLNEYLDGVLDSKATAAVEHHLEVCAGCRTEMAELRSLAAATAALPRSLTPPPASWERLQASIVAVERRRRWQPILTAAAGVALAAVLAAFMLQPPTGTPTGPAAAADIADIQPAATVGTTRGSVNADLVAARADFRQALTVLRAALQQRRDSLSPATLAVVEENLNILEAAGAATLAALEDDPGNTHLGEMLTSLYRQQVDLLRRAVGLPGQA